VGVLNKLGGFDISKNENNTKSGGNNQ